MGKASKKIKVLVQGDSPASSTGFGNVNRIAFNALHELYPEVEATFVGINDKGGYKNPSEHPYKIYPAIYDDPQDVYGIKRILGAISKTDPEIKEDFDVLFLNIDFFILHEIRIGEARYIDYLREAVKNSSIKKTILHTPIDHDYMYPGWIEAMSSFDQIISTADFGKSVITKHSKELASKTDVIYHGFEGDLFYPLPKKSKEELRKKHNLEGKYIVGFVGRNGWRKDFYHLVKVFSLFKKEHPNALLYLHTAVNNYQPENYNIPVLMEQFGLKPGEDYLLPYNLNENNGIERASMNEIYNLMDVFLSTSVGEGFGMPIVEAMLAGVPVVLPNNTTHKEFVKGFTGTETERGFLYGTDNRVVFGQFDFMRARPLADVQDALLTLKSVNSSKVNLERITKKAREWALTLTPERQAEGFFKHLNIYANTKI